MDDHTYFNSRPSVVVNGGGQQSTSSPNRVPERDYVQSGRIQEHSAFIEPEFGLGPCNETLNQDTDTDDDDHHEQSLDVELIHEMIQDWTLSQSCPSEPDPTPAPDPNHLPCNWFNCSFTGPLTLLENHLCLAHLYHDPQLYICAWINCPRNKPFRIKVDFVRHVFEKHLHLEPFKCLADNCTMRFKTEEDMAEHIDQVHSDQKDPDSLKQKVPNQLKLPLLGLRKVHLMTTDKREDFQDQLMKRHVTSVLQTKKITEVFQERVDPKDPIAWLGGRVPKPESTYDYFDERIFEPEFFSFTSTIVGVHQPDNGKLKLLLRWEPCGFFDDEWINQGDLEVKVPATKVVPRRIIPKWLLERLFEGGNTRF